MIMTIYRQSCIQFCIKKLNLAGYIQYNKKMVGQTQRPWVRQNPTSCLTQCQTEKKGFRQLCVIFIKKQHGARPCMEKMQFIFFVPPKIWMYPQMKKPVGMLIILLYNHL